ncbi:hypothetical protein [Nonomuraea zeae]|uniref:Uncharacterized protein n=1 Tax=Nonomuraea zeae TaxID=1642303 RepID=A0A5S4GMP9_9ACTN|nr:hypothetical protein [Nonomuraea zeae]TMR34215.1 hypothetical protein ETD85_17380 [Nonomuraea zeae]
MKNDIDRLVAGIAPDPGPGDTALAGELLEEIISTPRPAPRNVPRRRSLLRRRWLAAPVLAAAAAVATFAVNQVPAAAALDIERVDDHYVITVKDLMADPSVYQSELKARGLDITLTLTPTSQSLAGSLFVLTGLDPLRSGEPTAANGPITAINAPGPCHRFGGCPTGLKVPVGFGGKAEVILGRQAQPGEKYDMPPGIGISGEPLYCVDYVNKNVAEIRTLLRGRGVEPQFTSSGQQAKPTAPDDWYVHDGVMSAEGKALLLVGPDRSDKPHPVDASC